MTLKKTIELLKEYLKMNNIIELTNVNKYRLDEINKIRDYFNNEIKERKDIIKKLNKYLVSFDYLDKIFIALSASFGTLSIASYASGTSRYCRFFFDFKIYNRYRYKEIVAKCY